MTAIINDEASRVRTQVQSQPGRALTFDGVNDYVSMGNILNIGTGSISASAWVKTTNSSARAILVKNTGAGGVNGFWGLYLLSGKAYAFLVYNAGSDVVVDATSAESINDGTWQHVAMVYNRTDLRLYVNGVLRITTSASAIPGGANLTNTTPLIIGANSSGGHLLGGQIHDVRVYNRALTAAEISNLYNATKQSGGDVAGTLYAANLIGWWPLEDLTFNGTMLTSLAFDASGNNRHGKIIGPTYHSDAVVPCSIQNELGYSNTAVTIRSRPQTFPGLATFTATGAGTTALSGQTWDGRSGLFAVKFASGATGGYANNRVDTFSSSTFIRPTGTSYAITSDVALSRRLVGSEILILYFTGAWGDPKLTIDTTNQDALMPNGVMKWSSIIGAAENPDLSGSTGFVIYPSTDITGGDLTVYVDNVGHYELTASEVANGVTDGVYLSQATPALASDLTKDIFGNALHYPGPLAKRALPNASPCATFDGLNDRADAYGATGVCVYDGTSSFTATAWIRNTDAGWRAIAAKTLDSSGTTRNWGLFVGPSYQLSLWAGTNLVCEGGVISNSAWVHVAAVVSGTTGTLYINGVQVATGSRSAPGTGLTSQICIASEAGSLAPLQGRIVDVRLFDRSLSLSEINSVMTGNNITSGLVAHWPCAEKSLKLLTDISGNGNNALATGMTSAELWANTQDVYHAGLTAGVRTTNGRRGYRYFNGVDQYFTAQDASSPAVGGDVPFFVAACVRTSTIGAGAGVIVSKFDGGSSAKSFMLYRSGADVYFGISSNGTTVTEVSIASALTAGSIARVVAYHDPDANTIGLSVNGGAFTTAAYSSGIYNASSSVKVGAAETASYPWAGDMFYVGIALPASVPSWTAVRDALTQGLTYADLTPTQISDWGVTAWYDCDEWGPQLRDKHSDNHLTGANYSTDYPVPLVPALLEAPTYEYGTFSKELAGAFNGGHDAKYACTTGQKLWVAAMVRINLFSTAGDGIVSKYNAGTEWDLYAFNIAGDYRFYWIVYDSANVGQNVSLTGMAVGEWIFLFGYIDATSGLSIGLSSDGGAFVISSTASGPRAGTDNFQIGTFFSTAYLHGDIEYVAIGKAPLVSFSDVRDMLYGGGVPLRFGDLTAAQKTTIGLGEWFDVGEYDGSLTLTGKHAASALTGFCIPSQITHGGPKKLPAIDTAIDFTGGVAAPWTDKQYLGYLTCSGAANGRVVTAATAGKFASGNVSVYVRLRNFTTGSARLFFDNYNASPLARGAFGYNSTGGYLSLYDTAYHDIGASVDSVLNDGNWHDILYVWQGTSLLLYIDNVLWGAATSASNSATVSAQWSISTVLSTTDNLQKVVGDIARLIVADGVRVPGNITTAPNLLDLRFDSPNCEDEQCRIPSSAWLTGHTPAKLTVPTAYKHGVILPDGMVKTADELSERQFKLYKQDQ